MLTFKQYLEEVESAYHILRIERVCRADDEVQKLEKIEKILSAIQNKFKREGIDISKIKLNANLIAKCELFADTLRCTYYTDEELWENEHFNPLIVMAKKYNGLSVGAWEEKAIDFQRVDLDIFYAIKTNDFSLIQKEIKGNLQLLEEHSKAKAEEHYIPFSVIVQKMRTLANIPGRENDFAQFAAIATEIAKKYPAYLNYEKTWSWLLYIVFLSAKEPHTPPAIGQAFIKLGETLLDTIQEPALIAYILQNTNKGYTLQNILSTLPTTTTKVMAGPSWKNFVARSGLKDQKKDKRENKFSSSRTSAISQSSSVTSSPSILSGLMRSFTSLLSASAPNTPPPTSGPQTASSSAGSSVTPSSSSSTYTSTTNGNGR